MIQLSNEMSEAHTDDIKNVMKIFEINPGTEVHSMLQCVLPAEGLNRGDTGFMKQLCLPEI